MIGICIAAAQSPSIAGDIEANVATHVRFIEAAHAEGVELLPFPELSLCGYELPLLRDCLLTPDDARLAPLRNAAIATGMRIIAAAQAPSRRQRRPALHRRVQLPARRHGHGLPQAIPASG